MKNKYLFSISVFFVLYFFRTSACSGITYNVPIQFSTIQAALNACNNYDTVLVDPGVYTDTIVWPNKKGLKLLSTGNENNTIIDVQFQGRALYISFPTYDLNSTTVIRGFTVRNGFTNQRFGGAVLLENGNFLLEDLIVTHNHCNETGGGFYISNYNNNLNNVTINRVKITYNDCITLGRFSEAGGIYSINTRLTISNSEISNNLIQSYSSNSGAGVFVQNTNVNIYNTRICNNKILFGTPPFYNGGGLFLAVCDTVLLTNCLIEGNEIQIPSAFSQGSAINILIAKKIDINHCTIANNRSNSLFWNSITIDNVYSIHDIKIRNSIIWSTTALSELGGNQAMYQVTNCDIKGFYLGTNCFSLDPVFQDTIDYKISYNSPCVENALLTTPFDIEGNLRPQPIGTNPDIGCYEIDQNILSSNELVNVSFLTAYPSIVTDQLNLRINQPLKQPCSIHIFDESGRCVYQNYFDGTNSDDKIISFDLSALSSGIYNLNVSAGNSIIYSNKILKE